MTTLRPDSEITTEIEITKIVPLGLGLAHAEGMTLFVSLAAPGDRVRVRITEKKKKAAWAEILEVLVPSPDRIAAPCKYFGTCGGCDFQQMTYQAQLDSKVGIIRDCLKRIGKIDWPGEIPIIGSPHEFEYRSRAQWHLDRANEKFGYLKRNSHEVVDVETCPILVPELNAELARLRGEVGWGGLWDDDVRVDAAAGDDGAVSIYSDELNEPTNEITSTAAGEKFTYSARAFFQGNRYMVEKLIAAALDGTGGGSALDLYCGVGLFTLPMARRFQQVTAIEENDSAVEFAEKNAVNAGIDNIQFWAASVRGFLKSKEVKAADLVLLDPPRSGAEPETIVRIAELKPQQISYVSCEPSILARDLRILLDRGYLVRSITALDLFPQTHHVETVVRLALK